MTAIMAAPRATRREWIGLAVIALPCVLYSMDLTVLMLAVPHISADLNPTSAQLLWMVDIYGFLVAGSLITMGTLGDRIGRRRLLMIGAAAFGAASVLAAFAPTAELLIVARALLGIAGATLAPSTLSLIRNMFHDPAQRTFAIGVWITSYSAGAAIGPLAGGIMLAHFWWGSVFLLGVPVMALLLLVGPFLLPEFRDPHAGRLDLVSAAMSLLAVLAMIYGLKRIAVDGLDAAAAGAIAAGLAVGVAFVRRQRRLAEPLIDLGLFRAPGFAAALVTNILGLCVAFGFFLYLAQYLQLVLGQPPLQAGLWMLPSALSFVVGSMGAPLVLRRFRAPSVLGSCLMLAALGFAIITRIDATEGLPMLVAGSVVFSLALSPVVILTTDLIVGSAPPERAGAAAAISETGAEFGGALGIAILGSIGTAVYRMLMADAVPADVPVLAADAARSTLGGAQAVAEQVGPQVFAAARAAFTQSLQVVAGICAGLLVATSVLVTMMARRGWAAAR
jgi:DHA2 family multidrug resistance protein-like MFS transporter